MLPFLIKTKVKLIFLLLLFGALDIVAQCPSPDPDGTPQDVFVESLDCPHTNVNCINLNVTQGKDGIVFFTYVKDNGNYGTGSGTLINNTELDGKVYILTASHVISSSTEAATMRFHFNYELSGCSPNYEQIYTSNCTPSTTLVAYAPDIDFALVELNSGIPSGAPHIFNGWDVTNSVPSAITTIHHPGANPKKISISNSSPIPFSNFDFGFTNNLINNTHWKVDFISGDNIESGSSGSPLFDGKGRVIGILSGQYGLNECNKPSYFQMISTAWDFMPVLNNQLKAHLDPNGSNIVKLDSYDPSDCTSHYEPNNTGQFSQDIFAGFIAPETGFVKSFIHSGTDVDYFTINLQSQGKLELQLTQQASNYNITLFDEDGLQVGASSGGSDVITWENGTANASVKVKIYSDTGASSCNPYKLTIDYQDCSNLDVGDTNNSATSGTPVLDSYTGQGYLTTSDEDWYCTSLTGAGVWEVEISNLPEDYEVEITDGIGSPLGATSSTGNNSYKETYVKTSTTTDNLCVNVTSPNSNYNDCEAYDIDIDWTPSTSTDPTSPCIPITLSTISTDDSGSSLTPSAPNGTATVTINTGTGNIMWSNGQTTATATGLGVGMHTVTVSHPTDSECSTTVTVNIEGCTSTVPGNFPCCPKPVNNFGTSCSFEQTEISTSHTKSFDPIPSCDAPGNNDVWHSFVIPPTSTGIYTLTTRQDPSGASGIEDIGAAFYVVADCSDYSLTSFEEKACIENSLPYNDYMPEEFNINLSAHIGEEIYIRFWEFGNVPQYGSFEFCLVEGDEVCDNTIIEFVESTNTTTPVVFGEDNLVEGQDQFLEWKVVISDPTFTNAIVGIYNEEDEIHRQNIFGDLGDTIILTPSIDVTNLMGTDTGTVYQYRILINTNTTEYSMMTSASPLVCIEEITVYKPYIDVYPLSEIRHETGDLLEFNLCKNIQEDVRLWVLNTATLDSIEITSTANFTDSTSFSNPCGIFTYDWTIPNSYGDGSYLLIARSTLDNSIVGRGANFFIGECIEDITTMNPILFELETLIATEFLCFNGLIQQAWDSLEITDSLMILEEATLLSYNALMYINPTAANTLPPKDYPVPFGNLQTTDAFNSSYFHEARALLYLHYDDAYSAIPRNWYYYPAPLPVTRGLAIRMLMETFDVGLETNVPTTTFADVGNTHPYADWINYAVAINLIQATDITGGNFNPDVAVTRAWFYKYLFRIMVNYNINTYIQLAEPSDEDYYTPGNYSPETMPFHLGMTDGVVNFSGDSPISISGKGQSIGFSFGYSSVQTDLPIEFFQEPHLSNGYDFEPLGVGWSHNYNARVLHRVDPASGEERYIFISPSGRALTYDPNGGGFDAPSIYDNVFINPVLNTITVETNSLMTYRFEKDANANHYVLSSISDRYGNIVSLEYSNEPNTGLMRLWNISESNNFSRKIYLQYATSGDTWKIERIEENFGLLRDASFFILNNKLGTYTDVMGKSFKYGYGASQNQWEGLLTSVTMPRGNEAYIMYVDNKLKAMKVGRNNTTIDWMSFYDDPITSGSFPEYTSCRVTSAMNITSEYKKDGKGRMWNFTSPTSNFEVTDYASSNNLMLPENWSNNEIFFFAQYNNDGNNIYSKMYNNDDSEEIITERYFNSGTNNLDYSIDANGNTYNFDYDPFDGLEEVTLPPGFGNYNFTRNTTGQIEETNNPETITTRIEYDNEGYMFGIENKTLVDQEGVDAIYDMFPDDIGRYTSMSDPNTYTSSITYYKNGQIHLTENGINSTLEATYDDNYFNDTITNIKGDETIREYSPEESYQTLEKFGSSETSATQNLDGSPKSISKGGQTFPYIYDPTTRLLKKDPTNSYEYTSDGRFNLDKVESNIYGNEMDFEYDGINRMKSYTYKHSNNDQYKVGYDYDDNGNVTQIDYYTKNNTSSPLFSVQYIYDELNRCTDVMMGGNTIVQYDYYNDGRLHFEYNGNGTIVEYKYDAGGRLKGIYNRKSNNLAICNNYFELDAAGYHTKETYGIPGADAAIPMFYFSSTDYEDAPYNLTGGMSTNGNYEDINFYDGNALNIGNVGFVWDFNDQLQKVYKNGTTRAEYHYDSFGNRRWKKLQNDPDYPNVSEITYNLDILGIGSVLSEDIKLNDGTINTIYYIHSPNGLVCRMFGYNNAYTNVTEYYHYDYRGSVLAMTNQNQNITHCFRYTHDGLLSHNIGQNYDNEFPVFFTYVGKYGIQKDVEGLYYMRARYMYQPLGKFLSEDAVWASNYYPYADNNSIDFVDINGKDATVPLAEISGYEEKGCGFFNLGLDGEFKWITPKKNSSIGFQYSTLSCEGQKGVLQKAVLETFKIDVRVGWDKKKKAIVVGGEVCGLEGSKELAYAPYNKEKGKGLAIVGTLGACGSLRVEIGKKSKLKAGPFGAELIIGEKGHAPRDFGYERKKKHSGLVTIDAEGNVIPKPSNLNYRSGVGYRPSIADF